MFFENIPVIPFEGPKSNNPMAFKFYNPDQIVMGKPMSEHLPFALGLLKAAALIEDGRLDNFIEERYSSYRTGIGAKIRAHETTLEVLSDYACRMGTPELPGSGRQEYLEAVVNSVLFRGV